jgi:activator of HSP90 ATPase
MVGAGDGDRHRRESAIGMLKTIEQSVRFSASAEELYDIYMDPRRHAAATGAPVKISAKAGSQFSAFEGALSGIMLVAIPRQLIVQRWRSTKFYDTDLDSILTLRFVQDGQRGRIDLVHLGVPKQDFKGVNEGWRKYYWTPLRAYLKKQFA